ncbi:MAG: DUF4097 family beta strand repeat-containing protein [Romboutsia sp.]|uniref:DUF4097 family beta strand repeat-containing protein n=1 Tax=Romboutsia sp. TaxID=1965302 RepID=UPI003F3CAFE1
MKFSKLILKISLGLIAIGIVLSSLGFLMGGKTNLVKNNFVSISSDDTKRIIETKKLDDFDKINIDVKLDYIELIKSNENKLELNYNENLNKVDYQVQDGNLTIMQTAKNQVGVHVNLLQNRNLDYMKLYIKDSSSLENLNINVSDSEIKISEINSNLVDIISDYGNVDINNLNSNKINLSAKDGNINLDNINVSDKINVNNNYGEIDISNSNFENFSTSLSDGNLDISNTTVKTSDITNKYGNITLSDFLSSGLNIDVNDGNVDLIGSFMGDTNVNNKYGNIDIISNDSEDLYNYSIINKYGDINVGNQNPEGSIIKNSNGKHTLNLNCNDGNINVTFKK